MVGNGPAFQLRRPRISHGAGLAVCRVDDESAGHSYRGRSVATVHERDGYHGRDPDGELGTGALARIKWRCWGRGGQASLVEEVSQAPLTRWKDGNCEAAFKIRCRVLCEPKGLAGR